MNAKLAVAISLGASSLALFGMANVANADTVTTQATGENQPVVQPSNENPVEKAKKEANQAVAEANEQKDKVDEEVNKAESEVTDAHTAVTDANKEVTKAQKDLENKKKEAQTAEEQKKEADKELADKQAEVENANKEVADKQAALDKETANQKTAEDKLNKTKGEKTAAEGELQTENSNVQTKTTEQAQAAEKVNTEKGKLDSANSELQTAQDNKKKAQEQATQLSSEADQKEAKQKEAEQAVKDNTKQQEEKQTAINNLQRADSGTTSAEVQKLKEKAQEAKEASDQAQREAAAKAQEATDANNAIPAKAGELTNAEKALKDKNSDYAALVEKVTSAEGEAAKKAAAYDAADNNAPKDDIPVEQKSDFYKFLQYVIDTESKKENKNADLIEDAKRAQKVLKGESYEVPNMPVPGKEGYYWPGYTAYAPTWYNDLVKPGLGRVGSADSLENMKQAATYYKALDDYRKDDVSGMKTVKVRLTLIAESIVHSFYSAATEAHAACHDTTGSKTPDELKTHAYATNVAENLAWDGDYNNYDPKRPKQNLKQCNTGNGHLSCQYTANEKHNAVDGWYGLEKEIYDNALKDGKWNGHEFTEDGLDALKNHRTDFGAYLRENPTLALFKDDSNGQAKNLFKNVVGHYTNFSANNNFASGFAKADNSHTNRLGYQDIAVWHGGNEESSISIEEYNKLLNGYANSAKSSSPALSDEESEKLNKLNADANSANMAVFNAKYEALKAKSAMTSTERTAIEILPMHRISSSRQRRILLLRIKKEMRLPRRLRS